MWMFLACGFEIGVGYSAAERADADADGYRPLDGDCDDARADVFPGATEVCDGVDQSCDGAVDEGPNDISTCARTEEIVQVASTDLLVVIDNSPGTAAVNPILSGAATDLLTPLLLPGADIHVAVATTGALDAPDGVLRDVFGRIFVDQGTGVDAASDWLAEAVRAPEQVLDAKRTRAAIEAAILTPSERDVAFGRAWAALAVLIVAEEDDDAGNLPYVTDLIRDLGEARGLGRATVHAITGVGDGKCEMAAATETLALVELSGGTATSACATDFAVFSSSVGQLALQSGLHDRFMLSDVAVESSLSVVILLPDGSELAIAPDDVVYDPKGSGIWLSGFVPPVGSIIRIEYLAQP